MKSFTYIISVAMVALPIYVYALESIQISASDSGGIKSVTSATASSDDASASINVKNTVGSNGQVEVNVETEINGAVEQKHIQEKIEGGGNAEIYVERTNENPSTNTIIEINSGTSSTKSLGMFYKWAKFFYRDEEEMDVGAEVVFEATSSPSGTNIFASMYRNIIRLFASIW